MMTRLRKGWRLSLLTLMLGLGVASLAWAGHGMGPGMGYGCGMGPGMGSGCGMGSGMGWMNLTPEQVGQVADARHKFINDTAEVRKQLMVKQAELRELWKAKEPDKTKIDAKQKEINAVREQYQEKANAFKLEMRKRFPAMGAGPGCPMMAGGQAPAGCPMMAPPAAGDKK